MRDEARTWAERWLLRWSQAVRRRRRIILAVASFVAVGALWLVFETLGVNTDTSSLVSDDLEFRRTYREYRDVFGDIDEELIVLIDAETPALADAAARRLAGELSGDSATFSAAVGAGGLWPAGVSFSLSAENAVRE